MFSRDKDWAQVVKANYFLHHYFTFEVTSSEEKRVSTQAKPISEVVKDFEQSLETYRPSIRRVYVAGARAALRAASIELSQNPSTNELLASIAKSPTPKRARISPFLTFLAGPNSEPSASDQDLAALCAAPQKGTPRKWPLSCLTITGTQVLLWQTPIKERCFVLALRFWQAWRERLSRPDQCRLYRKSLSWSKSSLLFPGPHGARANA